MATLNDTFKRVLTQEDKDYESGSEILSIPTPLRRALQIYHASMSENMTFDPTTPFAIAEQHPEHSPRRFKSHSPVYHHLVFTSSDDKSPARTSDPCFQHHSPLQGRAESPSPLQHIMDCHHTSTPSAHNPFQDATAEEKEEEKQQEQEQEDFPTAPLDNDIWLENSVPDRHMYS